MVLHPTTLGDVRLRLRAYPYSPRSGRKQYDPRASVDLHLDAQDVARSEPVLADSQALAFELWVPADTDGDFRVYLGRDLTSWDDKLAIQLRYRSSQTDAHGDWDLWWAELEDDDVGRIRKEYWCAAQAQVTVCTEPRAPLTRPDGAVVRTTVGLGYSGDYEALYQATLDDLAQASIPGHLAAPFQRYMSFARRDPGDTLAYSLYKRLRAVAEDIERVARSIHVRPDDALAPAVTYRDVPVTAAAAYLHQRAGQVTIADVSRAVAHRGRLVPTAFTEVAPAETTDTSVNRGAAFALCRVTEAVDLVRDHLRQEEGLSPAAVPEHQRAILWLDGLARRIRRYRRTLPPPVPLSATTASFDSRYASLQRLVDTLDYVLSYVDGDTVPFEVQAFWKLYERWCFIQVVEALQACGFTVASGTRRASHFYRHPVPDAVNCEMRHPALPETVLEVWYDKRYPQLWSKTDTFDRARPYGLERRYGRSTYQGGKNRPDIVLEFHDHRSRAQPDIVVLDPTIRARRPPARGPRDQEEDKYDYMEAIRSFVETDNRGHSVPCVRASWGITPSFKGTEPYALAGSGDFTKGFVHLRPGAANEKSLETTLRQILSATNILPNETIP